MRPMISMSSCVGWSAIFALLLALAGGQEIMQYCDGRTSEGKIVDIKSSTSRGARMLQGTRKPTMRSCVLECCGMEGCNLVVFNKVGLSTNNRNCYLVSCGDLTNQACILVNHTGFSSVFLYNDAGEMGQSTNASSIAPPPTPTEPRPNELKPSHLSTSVHPSSTATLATNPGLIDSSVVLHTSEVLSATSSSVGANPPATAFSSRSSANLPSSSSPTQPVPTVLATGKKIEEVDDESKHEEIDNLSNQADGNVPSSSPRRCGNGSCSATKVAGLVVASIILVMLLLIIVIVVARKSWQHHYSKKYRNVDYLIDGMYS